jgi:hypothetical protein
VDRRPAAARPPAVQSVDDVVRDPVALVLAAHELVRRLRALGMLGEQLAQQPARALDVAPGLHPEVVEHAVPGAAEKGHRRYGTSASAVRGPRSRTGHSPFTTL